MNAELEPQFTTTEAARAVGIEDGLLGSWLARKLFKLNANDIANQGQGTARRWSRRTVRMLSLMFAFWSLGIGAARSATTAEQALRKHDDMPIYGRLFITMDKTGAAQLVAINQAVPFEEIFDRAGAESLAVIDATRLFRCLDERLSTALKYRK